MPKINKSSVKNFKSFPTLKVFKYTNSQMFHAEMNVSTKVKFIENKKIYNGIFRQSLKTKNIRDAEHKAKQIYRQVFSKIDSGEINQVENNEINFDKDIVESYFNSRQKLYQMKDISIGNLQKEKNQYFNNCSQFFNSINYNNEIEMNDAVLDCINHLKEIEVDRSGKKMSVSTISKYMNIISQICQHGQKKGILKSLPDIPTFSRLNEEVPPYFPKDIKIIRNKLDELFRTTEKEIYKVVKEYVEFLSALKINRAGLNALNVKRFQFSEVTDYESNLPIVKVTLFKTKNKQKVSDVVEQWFVEQNYLPNIKNQKIDEYIFANHISERHNLYEKIRKTFVQVSSDLGLYLYNGKKRPLTSIRHMNALKIYENTKDLNKVAQGINTGVSIVQSNYLNQTDEWARNRFKELGYNKNKKYQKVKPIVKSKNKD